MSLSALSTHLLNTSRDGDSTTSLGSLFQCLTILSVKKSEPTQKMEEQLERNKLLCSPQWGVNIDNPRMTVTGLKFKLFQVWKKEEVVQSTIWLPTDVVGMWHLKDNLFSLLPSNLLASQSLTQYNNHPNRINSSGSTEFKNNTPLKQLAWMELIL